jgi:hypothetical protein
MLLDGSRGHRPMIRRPSDMVSIVDRRVDGWLCCELCVKKVRYSHKKIRKGKPRSNFAQLTFFNR